MRLLSKWLFYLLAFTLPFGSVNPFNLSSIQNVDNIVSAQMGISPILLALCSLVAILDGGIFRNIAPVKKFIVTLAIFFVTITLSSAFYSGADFPWVYLAKLLAVIAGFIVLSLFFRHHQKILDTSMSVYAYTSTIIVLTYFVGLLDGFYYTSNGRLWIFGINPNTFSFLMGFGALILSDSFNHPNIKKPYVIINIVSISLILIYIVLSGSRGTFLTVSVCMVIILHKKMKSKFYYVVPMVLIFSYLAVSYYNSHQEEISLFERLSDTGTDERAALAQHALELYEERPFIGYGVNGYQNQMMSRFHEVRDSHNVILTNMAMSGTVGSIAFITFLIYLFLRCWRNRKQNLLGLVLFIDVFLMSMKTGGVLTFAMMWYAFAAVYALSYKHQNIKQLS